MRLSGGEALAAKISTLVFIIYFLKIESITKSASILSLIINKKVAKTKTSFLAGWNICLHNVNF